MNNSATSSAPTVAMLRSLMLVTYRLIGAKTGEILLGLSMRLIWRISPSILGFTYTIEREKIKVAFRPLILADISIINSVFESDVKVLFHPEATDVVIDVGAHIGLYSVIAGKLVGPKGRVIAIEPDESNLTILRKNVQINNLSNVTVLPIALGQANASMVLYSGVMPSASTLYPSEGRVLHKVRSQRKVRVAPLNTLVKELGLNKVDWLKIDVEGADLDVLKGAGPLLQNSKTLKIMVRVTCDETLECLKENGFQLEKLSARYYFATKN